LNRTHPGRLRLRRVFGLHFPRTLRPTSRRSIVKRTLADSESVYRNRVPRLTRLLRADGTANVRFLSDSGPSAGSVSSATVAVAVPPPWHVVLWPV
jgi:hypothetical protein